jgi:UDP-N-acetylmuramoyl-tripeptide--D-alanyl-D-alanine ligase
MNLTLERIAEHTGGKIEGPGGVEVRGCSIDTRTIRPGELFIAICGPRVDGHEFLATAAQAGARAAIVSEALGPTPGLSLVRVASTLDALHALARGVRRDWGKTVIGVTGSAGKTTTKELVAAVLGRRFRVLRSSGNLNNTYGMPLCLLRVELYHDMAVLEMGMSARGEIRDLAAIATPNEAVVTNVGAAHLHNFRSVDEIAKAKAELLGGLEGERRAYLNNGDSRVRAMARDFDGEIVTYGVNCAAAFQVTGIEQHGLEATSFTMRHRGKEISLRMPLLGAHNVANAAAAISVGVTHGIDWDEVRTALGDFPTARMRGAVVKFRDGFTVIDDSYNSNPAALSEMIRMVGSMPGYKRRILVAGDMLELGPESPRLHARSGEQAVKARFDLIVGVGDAARHLIDGARRAGAPTGQLHHATNTNDAGEFVASIVEPGDLILLKGSRGVGLDGVLDSLRLAFASMEP